MGVAAGSRPVGGVSGAPSLGRGSSPHGRLSSQPPPLWTRTLRVRATHWLAGCRCLLLWQMAASAGAAGGLRLGPHVLPWGLLKIRMYLYGSQRGRERERERITGRLPPARRHWQSSPQPGLCPDRNQTMPSCSTAEPHWPGSLGALAGWQVGVPWAWVPLPGRMGTTTPGAGRDMSQPAVLNTLL